MWATWTCWLMPLMSITAPQKHLDWPLASCVGSLHPKSHIAYFHAVQARVLPIFVEVGLCAIGEKDPPGFLEIGARLVEGGGRAGRAVPRLGVRIEAAAPLPLISAERIARAEPDRTNVYVAIVDQPALLSGIGIAAAGEGGHSAMMPPIHGTVKPQGLGRGLAWTSEIIH
jgi:hypothetical protein